MPELPDIVVYLESLRPRVLGRQLESVRIINPFTLRSFEPPIGTAEGKESSRFGAWASGSCWSWMAGCSW